MNVKARMLVESVTLTKDCRSVVLRPVTTHDPNSPNYSFSKHTPSGKFELTITNPEAWPLFEPGASLDITFEPTPPAV
jgi:hypothetical protein